MSIRILDVDRMATKSTVGQQDPHPVISTLYDHSDAILSLSFHPTVSVLASGSRDNYIKFFDYSKPSVKRAYRSVIEVASVRCLTFHPSGDYILVGTEQSTCEEGGRRKEGREGETCLEILDVFDFFLIHNCFCFAN